MSVKAEGVMKAMAATTQIDMGHQSHPLLGQLVADTEHGGQIGVLRAVAPDVDDIRLEPVFKVPVTPPVAWLRPAAGGTEWTTSLDAIEEVLGANAPGTRLPAAASRPAANRKRRRRRKPHGRSSMCRHDPPCPSSQSPDRDAAKSLTRDFVAGWSLLCNGVLLFDDTGELLPDGSSISPNRRYCTAQGAL